MHEFSQDLSLRWVSDGYPTLHSPITDKALKSSRLMQFTYTLGGTARWLQLQPSSAWPRPTMSAFQYFRWCALTKPTVSHLLRWKYSSSKGLSRVITVDVAVDPSFLVILCIKYSPSRWLQQVVTMVATDVQRVMTRVAQQFWRTCPADNSRNMF